MFLHAHGPITFLPAGGLKHILNWTKMLRYPFTSTQTTFTHAVQMISENSFFASSPQIEVLFLLLRGSHSSYSLFAGFIHHFRTQRVHWSRGSPALVWHEWSFYHVEQWKEREKQDEASGTGMRRILEKLHTFSPEILSRQKKQLTEWVEMKFLGTRGRYLRAKTA